MVWVALGLATFVLASRLDYHELRRPAVIWTVLGVSVAALVAVFFFDAVKGARRWISVEGFTGQPSELAKLVAIIFAAALLERRMHRIDDARYALLPIGIVTLVLAGLILLEPDYGTASMLVAVVTAIVFSAGLSYRYLFGTLLVLVPTAMFLILSSSYRSRRFMAFLDPWAHKLGAGYQVVQSMLGVGSGGLVGQGLMDGRQKITFLPEPHNDFIFSVIGEELGLIGATAVLLCFVVIAWRGLRTALVAPDRFGALMAVGLTTMVTLQALVNMGVVLSLLPAKGIPLPIISAGGSSFVANLAALGILVNISQQASPTAGRALEPAG
jgi:cell division protein FtsW